MGLPGISVGMEDASGAPDVPTLDVITRWVDAALRDRCPDVEVFIRVVGEVESAELNSRYRGKQGPTNVLSFPAELPAGVPAEMLGDLVICAPVVVREANEQGKRPEAHWAHLVVHGCLHLAGYDHEDEAQAAEMEPLETAILAKMGYPDPYAPR